MKPKFIKYPRRKDSKLIYRGKKGGRRAHLKKKLWQLQKKLSQDIPDIRRMNSRDFRHFVRCHSMIQEAERVIARWEISQALSKNVADDMDQMVLVR